VLQSNAVTGNWEVLKFIATMGHLSATAAWLGGLVALGTVLIPGQRLNDLHSILPSFSTVAVISVITLTVTGLLHAVAVSGGISPLLNSTYGAALAFKVGVFGLMLVLGDRGRRYATKVAQRRLDEFDDTAAPAGIHALAVAIGAELTFGLGVLGATAILVWFAP
jgi:copper transport protein